MSKVESNCGKSWVESKTSRVDKCHQKQQSQSIYTTSKIISPAVLYTHEKIKRKKSKKYNI